MLGASVPAREPPAGQLPLDRSSPPPTVTPDAECPPATTEVPPDRNSAKASTLPSSLPDALQPGNVAPQADCYLSPQEAAAQFRNGTAYLIDIRARSAFDQYRIPGAFNLPAYAIKTKPFLKNQAADSRRRRLPFPQPGNPLPGTAATAVQGHYS